MFMTLTVHGTGAGMLGAGAGRHRGERTGVECDLGSGGLLKC
jgi:hypothetical protein